MANGFMTRSAENPICPICGYPGNDYCGRRMTSEGLVMIVCMRTHKCVSEGLNYFDAEGKDEAVATIDGILGSYNREFEKLSGETNTEEGLKAVIIVLEAKPAIRFVLPEGKTAESYTFTSGGNTLAYTSGTYTEDEKDYVYLEVELYAYQMINEIEYTDGTYSGKYHINSYYDFVTTDENYNTNTNLISLVEKLYNYCKSADAYREAVRAQ